MARSFLTHINLNQLELQNAVIQRLATAPSPAVTGQFYYNTTNSAAYYYNGADWINMGGSVATGLLAARPTAVTANANTLYYATDKYLLYVSNGSAWAQISAFGAGESSTLNVSGSAANGTSTNYARADHAHAGPGFGTPTAQTSYGATSANGSATTPARSDHTHGTPSLTAVTPQAVAIEGTAAVGTGTAPAREDHTHAGPGFGTITAQTSYGASSTSGAAATPARSDHTHGTPALTSATPQSLAVGGTAAVGTGTSPAREDHVHAMPSFGTPTQSSAFGATKSDGTASTIARSDHTHGLPAHDATAHAAIKHSDLAAPEAATSWAGYKITNLQDPTAPQDAATKAYVDGVAQGLNVHDAVHVATTTNLVGTYANGTADQSQGLGIGATFTITANGDLVVDGHTTLLNERVLVKNQTTQLQNGIYYVSTVGSASNAAVLTRATDSNNSIAGQMAPGDFVFVDTGGQANTGWTQVDTGTATTPSKAIKIGTDAINYTQFSGAGTFTASNGVLLTGNNFTFKPDTTGGLQTGSNGGAVKLATNSGLGTDSNGIAVGAGTGITVSSGTVAVDTSDANGRVARRYAQSFGNGTLTSFTITHNLNSLDVIVQVYTVADGTQVEVDVTHTSVNVVTLAVATTSAPTTNQYRVVVFG